MKQVLTLCAIVLAAVQSSVSSQVASRPMALVGATIYANPNDAPIRDGVVLIREGRIAAVGSRTSIQVPKDAEVLDCSKRTIMAGFWNSHVHFMERKWANAEKIPAPELTEQLQTMLTQARVHQRLRHRIELG